MQNESRFFKSWLLRLAQSQHSHFEAGWVYTSPAMKTNYWGKIIGGFSGLLVGGPIFAIAGIWIGHQFDKGLLHHFYHSQHHAQKSFFDSTFLVMGNIAKADGHVSQNEINVAEEIMARLGLSGSQKIQAMHLFNQGKQNNFDLYTTLRHFRTACPFHPGLMHTFVDLQVQAAYADGFVRDHVKKLLQDISIFLKQGYINFGYFDAIFGEKKQQHTHHSSAHHSNSLSDAYQTLGIANQATEAEIKKAYRRMMNQYHPDKLTAKGLPEEMIKIATEKTQLIKKAYDQIRHSKGF